MFNYTMLMWIIEIDDMGTVSRRRRSESIAPTPMQFRSLCRCVGERSRITLPQVAAVKQSSYVSIFYFVCVVRSKSKMECSIYLDVLDVLGRGNVENDSLAHVVAEVEDQFGSDNAVQGVRSAPVGVTRSDAMEIQKVCRSQEIEGKRERERGICGRVSRRRGRTLPAVCSLNALQLDRGPSFDRLLLLGVHYLALHHVKRLRR